MSINAIDTSTSAVWKIHQHNPRAPAEPPDFSQFSRATTEDATAGSASGPVGNGRTRIGSDLNALLLDLQGSGGTTRGTTAAQGAGDLQGTAKSRQPAPAPPGVPGAPGTSDDLVGYLAKALKSYAASSATGGGASTATLSA